MKFTKSFWIALIIMIGLFILPTVLTFNAPTYDGNILYGFPLPFYLYGGMCLGDPCESFSLTNLIIDLLTLVAIPFVVNFIVLKIRKY